MPPPPGDFTVSLGSGETVGISDALHGVDVASMLDDMAAAVDALDKEGARVLLEMPFDWSELFGPENVRPDVPPVTMVGSEEMVGFRLELAESPARGEVSLEGLEGLP